MIEFTELAHVGVRVRAFGRSIAFYRMLGFDVVREDYWERVVVLQHVCGLELNLLDLTTTENDGRNILMDEAVRFPGFTHIALQVRDISAVKSAAQSLGLSLTEGPVAFGDGSISIFFRDPDGNVIELSESRVAEKKAAVEQQEVSA